MRIRFAKKFFSLFAALALVMTLLPAALAEGEEQLNLEGGLVSGNVLQLVIYSSAAEAPSTENLSVEMDGQSVALKSVNPISYADPGTSYIFLCDTNTAVTERALPDMRTIAHTVVNSMGAQDNVLIAPLGATLGKDGFLDDADVLNAQIDSLQKGSEAQDLYSSMYDALKLLSESDGIRARKCLIVIADGLDDQISGVSEMELSKLVEQVQIPVYVIALTYNTKTDARVQAAKTITSFARLSPGGLSILLKTGGAADAANQILAERDKTYLAVLDASAVRAVTSADQANVKISMTNDAGALSSARTISLTGLPAAEATPEPSAEPAAEASAETTVTPAVSQAPAPTPEAKGDILALLKTLPVWAYYVAGAVLVLVIALIVILLLLKKQRRRKETGTIVRFDESGDKVVDTAGPDICLIRLGAEEQICCEMRMPDKLVIGGDPKRAQLPLSGNPAISPVQCRLIWKNGSIWVEELSKHQRTELNGVPVGRIAAVKTGDVLRLGSLEYRIFWEKR